jgi:transcription elongation factor GreA
VPAALKSRPYSHTFDCSAATVPAAFDKQEVNSLSMNKIPMTAEGHNRLREELKRLKTVDRPAIIRAIAEARDHGDLAENAEYHSARDRQGFIEGRLAEIEDKIARAEVIDVSKLSGSVIKFGAKVTLADEETDEEQTFQIVGEDEADISQGRLSVTSPLARALIGKRTGESVEVATPRGAKSYEVVTVAFG